MPAKDIFSINREEFGSFLIQNKLPEIHKSSLIKNLYRNLDYERWDFPTLPIKIKNLIQDNFLIRIPKIVSQHISKYDHSVKLILEFHDQKQIEMVIMPEKNRLTLCISTQVGCRQACSFCHTGRMGLLRNLTSGEIVVQVFLANQWLKNNQDWHKITHHTNSNRISNIVFMGMGEPLDNVEELHRAIVILTDAVGLEIAPRKITVSTAGHIDGLNKLLALTSDPHIAISLHNPFNNERSKIMPINKTWPIEKITDWIKYYNSTFKKEVLLQYTLINKVNDSDEHALELARVLHDLKVKVNIIPFNPIDPSLFKSPEAERLNEFRDILFRHNIRVMVRFSKGQDIGAACGQLVRNT